MSNKEILERAITRAIDGGYELVKTKDWVWQTGESAATGLCIHVTPDTEKIGLITYTSYPIAYERVIFNHDFAKALFGEELHHETFIVPKELNKRFAGTKNLDVKPAWQYHLQQMVIADDPIKYLGENI